MWIFAELMLCDNPDRPVESLGIRKEQEATTNDFEQAIDSFANYTDVKEDVNYALFVTEFHWLLRSDAISLIDLIDSGPYKENTDDA